MSHPPLTIHDLYPELPAEKQREVEELFDQYLDLMLRTYERLHADARPHEQPVALTALPDERTIENGRSFTNQYSDTDV
jgi:hypothetical protein